MLQIRDKRCWPRHHSGNLLKGLFDAMKGYAEGGIVEN